MYGWSSVPRSHGGAPRRGALMVVVAGGGWRGAGGAEFREPGVRRLIHETRRGEVAMSNPVLSGADVHSLIMTIAASQHGVVARAQLMGRDVPAHRIDHRVATGFLAPIHRGVYGVASVPGRLRREFAGVLACGEESFVSHRAAGAVHGFVPPLVDGAPVSVSTRRDVRIRHAGLRVHRVSRLEADEVTFCDGLPLTGAGRTLLDLGSVTGSRELERALAFALRTRLVNQATLQGLIARHSRHPGRGRLRALLETESPPAFTRSEAERRFLELVRENGLPAPETNVIVEGFEVDFLWRRQRLIVEIDGRKYHDSDPAFERDRDRDTLLMAAGFRTMRVTWKKIAGEPGRVLVRLGQALVR